MLATTTKPAQALTRAHFCSLLLLRELVFDLSISVCISSGFRGADLVGLRGGGGRGGEERGAGVGAPHSAPAPSRRDGSVPKGLPPPSGSPPPCLCFVTPPTQGQLAVERPTPRWPRVPPQQAAGAWNWGSGWKGQAACTGGATGLERCEAVAPWDFLGATSAPTGPRLRISTRGGRRRGSGTRFLQCQPARLLPTSVQPTQARLRGSRRPGDLRPRIHISNTIFGAASAARRHAPTTASAFRVRWPKVSPRASTAHHARPSTPAPAFRSRMPRCAP